MTSPSDFAEAASRFVTKTETVLRAHPCAGGSVAISRAPAVLDVMGGIGEDSGALVLTATAALSFHAAAWRTADDQLRLRFISQAAGGAARDHAMPLSSLDPDQNSAQEIIARCREEDAEEIAPSFLAIREALADGFMPRLEGGLCLVVEHDFPDDADLGRHVAMKLLHEEYVADPEFLQRFIEEAQIGGQLQHPGIVPVYDIGLAGERPFFTMKLIKGRTLAALLDERLSPADDQRRFLGMFEQVCRIRRERRLERFHRAIRSHVCRWETHLAHQRIASARPGLG